MKARQVIAIVLWVFTGLSMLGAMISGNMVGANPLVWIGFFIPAIIGIVLWCTAPKNKQISICNETEIKQQSKNSFDQEKQMEEIKAIQENTTENVKIKPKNNYIYIDVLKFISFLSVCICSAFMILSLFRANCVFWTYDMSSFAENEYHYVGYFPDSEYLLYFFIFGTISFITGLSSLILSVVKKYRIRETIFGFILSVIPVFLFIMTSSYFNWYVW